MFKLIFAIHSKKERKIFLGEKKKKLHYLNRDIMK